MLKPSVMEPWAMVISEWLSKKPVFVMTNEGPVCSNDYQKNQEKIKTHMLDNLTHELSDYLQTKKEQ